MGRETVTLSPAATEKKTGISLGKRRYEMPGIGNVTVGWKEFSQPNADPTKATLFIPGWGYNEQSETITPLCESFAGVSPTASMFALQTRAERVMPNSFRHEAEAALRFIEERGLQEVTIAAHSFGGARAIHLVALLREQHPEIRVNGLVLIDSTSVYQSSPWGFIKDYARERRQPADLETPPEQSKLIAAEGAREIVREVLRSKLRYPFRLFNEIAQASRLNPDLKKIDVPVVLIQGAQDQISQVDRVIAVKEGQANKHGSMSEREHTLMETTFPASPYVRLLVGEKRGHHGLLTARPDKVVTAAMYTLERWNRKQQPTLSVVKH